MSDWIPSLLERYDRVQAQVGERLICVSKKQPATKIRALVEERGQKMFGENYLQELEQKAEELADLDIEWHFIGQLQSRKIKRILRHAAVVHAVDRVDHAQRIDALGGARIFVSINLFAEPQKSGVSLSDLTQFVEALRPLKSLVVEGVFCMPPLMLTADRSSPKIKELEVALEEVQAVRQRVGNGKLSYGTSHDYLDALKMGSDYIRIGTQIFGERE